MKRPWQLALGLAAVLALPLAARAQSVLPPPQVNRVLMEPYAGAFFDAGRDAGPDFGNAGVLAGVRLGYLVTPRLRLLGDLGYAQANRVAEAIVPGGHQVPIDARNFMATAGVELEAVPGQVSGTVSLQGGLRWRSQELRSTSSDNPDDYEAEGLIVPGVALRWALTSRSDVRLGVADYIALDEVRHNPAVTLGISFR